MSKVVRESILVTGASGLIGRSVVMRLLDRGVYSIIALDCESHPMFRELGSDRFEFVVGDCRDATLVDGLLEGVKGVVHLAAPASFLMYKEDPIGSTTNTVQSFLTVLEAMKKRGVKKIVHASTSAVYEGNPVPWAESIALDPPDLKAMSKKMNEEIGLMYAKCYGITAIAMRPLSVYGDSEDKKGGYANVTSLFAWAMAHGETPVVWSDGSQTRDFIHADDAAEVFVRALERNISSQAINVGTGIETSFNEVIAIINNQLGTSIIPQYVKVPIDVYALKILSDNTRLRKVLAFEPTISIESGIARILKSIANNAQITELSVKQLYYKSMKLS